MQMHLRVLWARLTTEPIVSHTELSDLKYTGLIFLAEMLREKTPVGYKTCCV